MRTAAALALLAATLPVSAALAQDQKPAQEPKVIAKVDGATITDQDLELAAGEIGEQLGQVPEAERRRVLVEFLVENQLIAAAAAKDQTAESSAYKSRMDYWRRRSLRDTYFEDKIRQLVTDADAKTAYDKEIGGLAREEEVKAAHILVASEEKAKEVHELLVHDGDFAELAKEHSLDPGSKTQGGDLGYFAKGRMVPEFEEAAFKLDVGQISKPVKSQFGWHIIKLVDKRTQEPPAFEELKDRIKVVLIRRKARELVDGFRQGASIEYVDPEIKAMVEKEAAQPGPGQAAPKQ